MRFLEHSARPERQAQPQRQTPKKTICFEPLATGGEGRWWKWLPEKFARCLIQVLLIQSVRPEGVEVTNYIARFCDQRASNPQESQCVTDGHDIVGEHNETRVRQFFEVEELH
jgi:hypothetical protein